MQPDTVIQQCLQNICSEKLLVKVKLARPVTLLKMDPWLVFFREYCRMFHSSFLENPVTSVSCISIRNSERNILNANHKKALKKILFR